MQSGAFDYTGSTVAIRADIAVAHRDFWQKLGRPGSWWTGAERIAIAKASRDALSCGYCRDISRSLSPYGVKGEHTSVPGLSATAIDAVHRVVNHAGRITRSWVEDNTTKWLSKAQYVELVGIVVCVLSIDEFHRCLDLPLEPLPPAQAGEITRYVPDVLRDDIGFVPTIPKDGAVGLEHDLWPGGVSANVLRALTSVPQALRDWLAISAAQYLAVERMGNMVRDEKRSIDRMQMELIAARVSSINECFY